MAWIDSNGLYHGTWDSTSAGCAVKGWPRTRQALVDKMQEAGCLSCHGEKGKLILFEEDWINLREPELSRILRAPLAAGEPGFGLGLCRSRPVDARRQRVRQLVSGYAHAVQPVEAFARRQHVPPDLSGEPVVTFGSTAHPIYQSMLTIIGDARKAALADARVDLPGAKVLPGASRQFLPLALPAILPRLSAQVQPGGSVLLSWDRRAELAGLTFELHRSAKADFAPTAETRIASTTASGCLDVLTPDCTQHYALILTSGDQQSLPIRVTVAPRRDFARTAPGSTRSDP